jgi:hypothetical protein
MVILQVMETARSEAVADPSPTICIPQQDLFRHTGLTELQAVRLFKAAIKDHDSLVDAIVEKVYVAMKTFDRERAHDAVELVVDRDQAAASRLRSLLEEMQTRRA